MSGAVEKIQRMISQLEEEIVHHKCEVGKREKELLMVEKSIAQVKMLQEKALHVIKCNEVKFRECEGRVEMMKGKFGRLGVTETEDVQGNLTDELLRKID
ncbi:uncharacterized protein LOC107036861 [Diachasma alloeum]|uniref:uncharacterized protein LOC107036861 n=1 Tax=Diachasma alloeum TaxID=454923 RepID=UPI0010FBB8FF|nr:uncharacterized protein LOC107036861 [Diachasma alloeum]